MTRSIVRPAGAAHAGWLSHRFRFHCADRLRRLTASITDNKIRHGVSRRRGSLAPLPPRSMVGQLTLDQHIGVRIPGGQPINMRGFAPLPCKLIFCVRTVSVFGGRSRTCLPAVCNAAAGLSATRNLFGDIRRQMCGKRPSTLCDRDSLLPRAALLRRSLLSAAIPRTNAGGLKSEILARVSAIRPGCYRAMADAARGQCKVSWVDALTGRKTRITVTAASPTVTFGATVQRR